MNADPNSFSKCGIDAAMKSEFYSSQSSGGVFLLPEHAPLHEEKK